MLDFSGKQTNKSIFSDLCDVSFGRFSPYIQAEEANNVNFSCINKFRQNIITCKDKSIDSFINEVNGLEFNVSLKTHLGNLPHYIPIIDYRTAEQIRLPKSIEYIGISLIDIIKSGFSLRAGRIHESKHIAYRNLLFENNNLKGKKIILFLTGPDTYIEGVWYKRETSRFLEAIGSMNFYAVTGFNFSVFGGECAFSQVLNLKRSLYSAYLLEQKGIKCIPHVYALNQFHLKRWTDFFNANRKIRFITMNCQFQKSTRNNSDLINTIKSILAEVPHIHIILQGFQFPQIHNFGEFIDRIHFAEKKAIKSALGFKLIKFNHSNKKLITNQRNKELERSNPLDLVTQNIMARKKYVESISISK
jgi:Domain of unknown function (DUF4417)